MNVEFRAGRRDRRHEGSAERPRPQCTGRFRIPRFLASGNTYTRHMLPSPPWRRNWPRWTAG